MCLCNIKRIVLVAMAMAMNQNEWKDWLKVAVTLNREKMFFNWRVTKSECETQWFIGTVHPQTVSIFLYLLFNLYYASVCIGYHFRKQENPFESIFVSLEIYYFVHQSLLCFVFALSALMLFRPFPLSNHIHNSCANKWYQVHRTTNRWAFTKKIGRRKKRNKIVH